MQVKFESKSYNLDLDEVTLSEARYIKRQTGLTLAKIQEGIKEVDPEAMLALYWLMKTQAGEVVDMNKVNFKIVQFGNAVSKAALTEMADKLGVSFEDLDNMSEEELEKLIAEKGKENPTSVAPETVPATT